MVPLFGTMLHANPKIPYVLEVKFHPTFLKHVCWLKKNEMAKEGSWRDASNPLKQKSKASKDTMHWLISKIRRMLKESDIFTS